MKFVDLNFSRPNNWLLSEAQSMVNLFSLTADPLTVSVALATLTGLANFSLTWTFSFGPVMLKSMPQACHASCVLRFNSFMMNFHLE